MLAQFTKSGHDELLRLALQDVFGVEMDIDAVTDPSISGRAPAGPRRPGATGGAQPDSASPPANAAPPGAGRRNTPPASSPPPAPAPPPAAPADGGADPDDPVIDEQGGSHHDLLARALGATVIQEIDHGQ